MKKGIGSRIEELTERIEKAKKERAKLEAKKERLDEDWKKIQEEAKSLGIKKKEDKVSLLKTIDAKIRELEQSIEEKIAEAEKAMGP